ncbi:MAG: hydrogenase formation protein HypD [Thermodesulfobacteriota bacterium]
MNGLASFRDGKTAQQLAAHLRSLHLENVRLMEVCGTHTVAIARAGIRQLMPAGITLTSGPGCPVCVTATADIDRCIGAARLPGVIIATFGDLLRVPGSSSTLGSEMSGGADIRVVYSPLDAVTMARENPGRQVIFLGVGFETTAPTVAGAILQAETERIRNFSVLSSHKVMPPALTALVDDPQVMVSGLICPGHVSIVIGADAYLPLAERYRIPCVITGFEPVDILQGIVMLARQIERGEARVEIAYQRAVSRQGNARAREVMAQVFRTVDARWRGLGEIADSGLAINDRYADFDADRRFAITAEPTREPAGCRCGAVLKGIIAPEVCKLFGSACTPERPVGPCMVSSEGACAARYRYQE